jgi:hypothetical protein
MIWFGKLALVGPLPESRAVPAGSEWRRMERALEVVACTHPHLSGRALVDALAATGWVDTPTAARLLPEFRHFDADGRFAEHLRSLSFRGHLYADEFRAGIARALEDITGSATPGTLGREPVIRFRAAEAEGAVLAYPEVSFSLGGRAGTAVAEAIDEMPDALVLIARNFAPSTATALAGMLRDTGIAGTLITVNHLLGLRATALRYQPPAERIVELLRVGRAVRSRDIARLA